MEPGAWPCSTLAVEFQTLSCKVFTLCVCEIGSLALTTLEVLLHEHIMYSQSQRQMAEVTAATIDGIVSPSQGGHFSPLPATLTGKRKALAWRDLGEVRCGTDGPPGPSPGPGPCPGPSIVQRHFAPSLFP